MIFQATERLGATPLPDGRTRFCVWAPRHARVEVRVGKRLEAMQSDHGYHRATLAGVAPGARYTYRLSGKLERPDPASRSQPGGVHEPSEVVDLAFSWTDGGWSGLALPDYVIYELHVGTFTREGTFDAVIPHLARLRELGITAIEIMPVAQFPGSRNWGYDGVYPFAVQDSYGGPAGLQRLVDACHANGLAAVLDVVYNHLGPEGNYLADYGPYFTEVYRTPWGQALNFDGPESDAVRRYFIENALQWVRDYHIDALRLDAVHAILDRSARPFLEELADEVHALARRDGRTVALIAESDLNDPRLIRGSSIGGYGLDSMWCDDFHHAAHSLLTGERNGYYEDFGTIADLAEAWNHGMTYAGRYSPHRHRRHGRPMDELQPEHVVVCTQNHDQVGNRLAGDRSTTLIDFEAEKLAAGILVLSPYLPLVFMGQEYGETAPFQYFVSHGDPGLVQAVRDGRRAEFQAFGWKGDIPDPQSEQTFERCVLDHALRESGTHATLYALYRDLLALRGRVVADGSDEAIALENSRALVVQRDRRAVMAFHFGDAAASIDVTVPAGHWTKAIDSAAPARQGPGTQLPDTIAAGDHALAMAPWSFVVYASTEGGAA